MGCTHITQFPLAVQVPCTQMARIVPASYLGHCTPTELCAGAECLRSSCPAPLSSSTRLSGNHVQATELTLAKPVEAATV